MFSSAGEFEARRKAISALVDRSASRAEGS
jgi:hypothetical protein